MINEDCGCGGHKEKPTHMAPKEKQKALLIKLMAERIQKVGDEYVVYPKDGGKRLGTHDTEEQAKKQLAAIEASKNEDQLEEASGVGGVQGSLRRNGEESVLSYIF